MSSHLYSGYTFDQLFPLIRATLDAGISVLLLGSPGIGKSTLAMELAKVMMKVALQLTMTR